MMRHPGSNWWSFDFHNHTPDSSDYNSAERTQLTPRNWLLAYMRSGTDCVAITDHNSGNWIDRLKQELALMALEHPVVVGYREIHLFPGVELTTAEGLHVIAVYGPDEGAAKIQGLLALARYNNDVNNAHGMCTESAVAICGHIHDSGGVVVLAHAEEINGIFHGALDATTGQFTPTRQSRAVESILELSDGIEIHDLRSPAIQHFFEKLDDRAIVDGSDAHKTSDAGTRRVWLKMAQPSIEGLKLALLDPKSSLLRTQDKPLAPTHRITSLRIENLHLRRQPLDIAFSPWFNAVIGGRGSGKSTLLETLRLVLARESDIQELGQDSDVSRAFKRFRQPGGARGNTGMVRADTVLKGTIEKYDQLLDVTEAYAYEWAHNSFNVKRQNEAGSWEDTGLNATQAAELFPVKVFSQKQIFELAERPSALLTYIDRVPEVDYQKWKEENDKLSLALRDLRDKERGLLTAIEKKAQLETELKEILRKTTAYQQSPVAQQVKTFRENQTAQQTVKSFADGILAPVQQLVGTLADSNPYENIQLGTISSMLPDPAPIQQLAKDTVSDLNKKYAALNRALAEMKQVADSFQAHPFVISFIEETDKAIAAYRQEVEKLRSEGVGTAQEAEAAIKRKQELESALVQIASQEAQLLNIKKNVLQAYAALKLNRRTLTRLRQNFVDSTLVANPNLRISIDGQADVQQSADRFRSILRLQENTFVDDVLAFDELTGQPSGLLGSLVAEGIHDPTHKRVTNLKLGILERSKDILGRSVNGKLLTAINRLGVDDDDALLEWFPEDKVTVEFRRNATSPFQSLERASAGQKTSSVLSFLLSHGNEPLLLDQPEDDLDNALVSELVVEQIRGNKSRRQIIVMTHNPNIVVNGDAELVLPMDFINGQIQQNNAGGLQERAVRERICDVMEGGRAAFRQRYKRILEDLDATN